MMRFLLAAALATLAVPAFAQTPAPVTVVTAAQVEALSQAAGAGQTQPNRLKPIIAAPGFTLNLEHRIARAAAAIHPTDVEWMIVLDGAATLTTGGKVAPAAGGDTIEGGQARHIVKGDMILVPENTPHMLAPDAGAVLVLATLHIPHHSADAPGEAKLFSAASDLPAMIEKAKAALPGAARFFSGGTLVALAPIRVGLEYRSPKGIASVHKKEGEFMYVIAGEGNVPTGGTVVNPKDSGANIDGDALTGATNHPMKAGDFIFVPAGTPHLAITDSTFVLATVHVPAQ